MSVCLFLFMSFHLYVFLFLNSPCVQTHWQGTSSLQNHFPNLLFGLKLIWKNWRFWKSETFVLTLTHLIHFTRLNYRYSSNLFFLSCYSYLSYSSLLVLIIIIQFCILASVYRITHLICLLFLTLPNLISPHLTSPHLTSPHLTSPHLTSPHLTSPHLTSHDLTWPDLT
jgi:hypothetical protein